MKSIHAFARNHWLLGAMLLVLHSAVYHGLHTPLGRSLLLLTWVCSFSGSPFGDPMAVSGGEERACFSRLPWGLYGWRAGGCCSTNMRFEEDLRAHPTVPAELFDGIVDNLLENAKHKQQLQPGIAIIVKLVADGEEGVRLEVCDNGEAVDGQKARSVLTKPVASDTGLGVGLFQAARHAESLGYSLDLSSNENGKVCFTLCKVCGNGAVQ